jgi:hypothetical protein
VIFPSLGCSRSGKSLELEELEELAELGLGLLLFRAVGGAFLPELEGELELKEGRC